MPETSIFIYLRIFAFIIYVFLACYIFVKNPKSNLNRLVALFISCFAIWTFALFLMWSTPEGWIDMWFVFQNVASIGWISFASIFLLFTLVYTGRKTILNFKPIYLIFVALPAFFIYLEWNRKIIVDGFKEWYGWFPVWSDSIWTSLFNAYYLIFMVLSLVLLIVFASKNKARRSEAIIISVTMVVSLLLGTLTDIVLPQIYMASNIPQFADLACIIWASGVVYAISKYNFLSISPAVAAENMISIMSDAMLLLDKDLNIIQANQAIKKIFGYDPDKIKGKPINFIINKEDKDFIKQLKNNSDVIDYETTIKSKAGNKLSTLLSTSYLKDDSGGIFGVVLVAKDITQLKKIQSKLKIKVKQLNRLNSAMVGREIKNIELKKEIEKLQKELLENNK